MRSVGVFAAKSRLTALLQEVEAGAEILITRRGKPVARLAPPESGFRRARAQQAAAGLRAASRGLRLGGIPVRELIEEERFRGRR